jgi:hypothetical protein
VRPGGRCLQRIFLKLSTVRVKPANFVCRLTGVPERAQVRVPDGAGRERWVGSSYSWICTFSVPIVAHPAIVAASVNKHNFAKTWPASFKETPALRSGALREVINSVLVGPFYFRTSNSES